MFREYVALTKPKLLRLNAFAAFAGFWLAASGDLNLAKWTLLAHMLIGITFTMASACVVNNVYDVELDKKMERTQDRALPQGRISARHGFIYAIILGLIGLGWLFLYTNIKTGLLAVVGYVAYVFIYTIWLKRRSTWSTSIGGISGATPPVVGYVAYTNEIDLGAWLLFALLFLWQPPHFWSLAIRRVEEYRAAGFPLLPVVHGITRTKWQMIPYITSLIPVGILMTTSGLTGTVFLFTSVLLSVGWLIHTAWGLSTQTGEVLERWAKTNFYLSLLYLALLFVIMIIDVQ